MTVGFHPSFYQFRFTSPSPPSVDLCHPFETEGGRSGDVGITNGDTDFSLGNLGSTIVVVTLNFTNQLKFNQVFADTQSR